MHNRIVLPKLLGFRIRGFQPIFTKDISMTLVSGPYIILGGNGLGKTTIVQAIVYGLVGGPSNENIEEIKSLRWDHGYFRERLSSKSELGMNVEVEVDFAFGNRQYSVRRGFKGSGVTGFREFGEKWITTPASAADEFQKCLHNIGGYQSENDFAFIVHKLLYLPESRRLIAWDLDTQIRILMLLNQDVISADEFRKRRKEIKEMDSRRRHIHVALGQSEKQLSSLMEYDENVDNAIDSDVDQNADESNPPSTDIEPLVNELGSLTSDINTLSKQSRELGGDLSKVSDEIDELRREIENAEAVLVSTFLREEEQVYNLALYKLLVNGICPICGTQQLELRDQAQAYNFNNKCVFCGSDDPTETNPELTTLRSRLAEKIRSQHAIESEYHNVTNQLRKLQRQADNVRININDVRFQMPVVNLVERHLPEMTQESLVDLRNRLKTDETDLLFQISEAKKSLTGDFDRFREIVESRIDRLKRSYQSYATEFLGLECSLIEAPLTASSNDIQMSRFLPFFDGSLREKPESCSEAQRFFLDIAFRMALIDLASITRDDSSTFICETPETALDLSYVDNVVRMFEKFSSNGHNLLLTANIQSEGVAHKLLSHIARDQRPNHLVDMLAIGRLSKVQQDALPLLRSAVNSMIGFEVK